MKHCYGIKRKLSSKSQEISTREMFELQRKVDPSFLDKSKLFVFLPIWMLPMSLEVHGREDATHIISLKNFFVIRDKFNFEVQV